MIATAFLLFCTNHGFIERDFETRYIGLSVDKLRQIDQLLSIRNDIGVAIGAAAHCQARGLLVDVQLMIAARCAFHGVYITEVIAAVKIGFNCSFCGRRAAQTIPDIAAVIVLILLIRFIDITASGRIGNLYAVGDLCITFFEVIDTGAVGGVPERFQQGRAGENRVGGVVLNLIRRIAIIVNRSTTACPLFSGIQRDVGEGQGQLGCAVAAHVADQAGGGIGGIVVPIHIARAGREVVHRQGDRLADGVDEQRGVPRVAVNAIHFQTRQRNITQVYIDRSLSFIPGNVAENQRTGVRRTIHALQTCSPLERCAGNRHTADGVVQQTMVHQIVLMVSIGKRLVAIAGFNAIHFFIGKGQGSGRTFTSNRNCAQRRDRVIGIAGQVDVAGYFGFVSCAEITLDVACRILRDAPRNHLLRGGECTCAHIAVFPEAVQIIVIPGLAVLVVCDLPLVGVAVGCICIDFCRSCSITFTQCQRDNRVVVTGVILNRHTNQFVEITVRRCRIAAQGRRY